MFFLDFKIKKGKAHYSSSKNENSHSKSNISVNEKLNVKPKALTKPPLTKK